MGECEAGEIEEVDYEEEYNVEEEEAFEETGGREVGGGRELWTVLWESRVRWDSVF